MSTVLSGFDSAYWNLAQVIAWVYLGDRKLVDDLGGSDTAPNRWTEVKLPDGSTEVAETSAPRPPSLRIDIIAASRGAGTMSPVPSPLRQHNPGGFEPAVPAPRSKRFISAFASRDDAEVDILRRLQDGTVPLSGKRRGRGLREIIPILQLLDATIDCDGNRITTKKGEWWGDVLIERSIVFLLWPSELSQEIGPAPTKSFGWKTAQSPSSNTSDAPSPGVVQMLVKYHEKFKADASLPGLSVLADRFAHLLGETGVKPRESGCSEPQFVMAVTRDWLMTNNQISGADPINSHYKAVLLALELRDPLPGYGYESFRRMVHLTRETELWTAPKT